MNDYQLQHLRKDFHRSFGFLDLSRNSNGQYVNRRTRERWNGFLTKASQAESNRTGGPNWTKLRTRATPIADGRETQIMDELLRNQDPTQVRYECHRTPRGVLIEGFYKGDSVGYYYDPQASRKIPSFDFKNRLPNLDD